MARPHRHSFRGHWRHFSMGSNSEAETITGRKSGALWPDPTSLVLGCFYTSLLRLAEYIRDALATSVCRQMDVWGCALHHRPLGLAGSWWSCIPQFIPWPVRQHRLGSPGRASVICILSDPNSVGCQSDLDDRNPHRAVDSFSWAHIVLGNPEHDTKGSINRDGSLFRAYGQCESRFAPSCTNYGGRS